ncbi:MAG: TIGR02147 family protein [Bdellovibrionales bacterium]|nr:TIGR02147 family protein [Bdellovibrionales bacterium]
MTPTEQSKCIPLNSKIFEFRSYLDVLQYYQTESKARLGRAGSLGTWSRRLGTRSTGTLANYLAGRKVPDSQMAKKLAHTMDLTGRAEEYFLLLTDQARIERALREVQVASPAPREALSRLRLEEGARVLDAKEFAEMNRIETLALREAVRIPGFPEAPAEISARFPLGSTESVVVATLEKLKNSGLIMRNPETGRLQPRDFMVMTECDVSQAAVRGFHATMFELARRALDVFPVKERNVTADFFLLRQRDLPKLKKRLCDYMRAIVEEFDHPDGTAVFTLGNYLFPIVVSKQERELPT